jgi:hypothetical protein
VVSNSLAEKEMSMIGMIDEAGRLAVVEPVATWTALDAPAANVAAVATKAAGGSGRCHHVVGVYGSFHGGNPAAGTLLDIQDGATTVWEVAISAAGPFAFAFPTPLRLSANATATARLGAGGAGVSGIVSLVGYTG